MQLTNKFNVEKGYDIGNAFAAGISPENIAANMDIISIQRKLSIKEIKQIIDNIFDEQELYTLANTILDLDYLTITQQRTILRNIAVRCDLSLDELMWNCEQNATDNLRELRNKWYQILGDELSISLYIINIIGQDNIIYTDNSFYIFNLNRWESKEDREIKQIIISQTKHLRVLKSKIDSILDIMKSRLYNQNIKFNQDILDLTFKNLYLKWDTNNFISSQPTKTTYNTIYFDINYDPYATAPRFEKFLQEIFYYDEDKDDKINLLLEMIGYTLIKDCFLERFFILVGSGCNGKSVFLNVIKSLLGNRNCSSVSMQSLSNKFQKAQLNGRLANIVAEISEGEKLPDEEIKALSSGEIMTIEKKFINPIECKPFATLIFATNHLPYNKDYSDAIYRRIIPVTFNRTFKPDEIDPNLSKELESEIPGIFNLVISALINLLRRESFIVPASSTKATEDWKFNNDHIKQFLEDCCKVGGGIIVSKLVYERYLKWCSDNGINTKYNRNNFTNRLYHFGVKPKRGVNGVRMLSNIMLLANHSE
ncbi:MAG: hypothetical protein J0G32_08525 [Alphaproteobacteria bacterium]|nr:hypothetical protein [Alphaproteobacteria bacterium]OJV14036.1 MAG: hypothetical protein BGO27_00900 [Alphaproteobacteria bacterium 33-17]